MLVRFPNQLVFGSQAGTLSSQTPAAPTSFFCEDQDLHFIIQMPLFRSSMHHFFVHHHQHRVESPEGSKGHWSQGDCEAFGGGYSRFDEQKSVEKTLRFNSFRAPLTSNVSNLIFAIPYGVNQLNQVVGRTKLIHNQTHNRLSRRGSRFITNSDSSHLFAFIHSL